MARIESATHKPTPKTAVAAVKPANGTTPRASNENVTPSQPEASMIKEFTVSTAKAPAGGRTWAQMLKSNGPKKSEDLKRADPAPEEAPPAQAEPALSTETPTPAPSRAVEPIAKEKTTTEEKKQPANNALSGAALWSGYTAKKTEKEAPKAVEKVAEVSPAKESKKKKDADDVPDTWEAAAAAAPKAGKSEKKNLWNEQSASVVVVSESIYSTANKAAMTQDSVDLASKRYEQQAERVVFPDNATPASSTAFTFSGLHVLAPPPHSVAAKKKAAPEQAHAPSASPVAHHHKPASSTPEASSAAPAAAATTAASPALRSPEKPAAGTAQPAAGSSSNKLQSWADGDIDLSLANAQQTELLNRSQWGSAAGPTAAVTSQPPPPPAPHAAVGTMPMPAGAMPGIAPMSADGAPFDRTFFGSAGSAPSTYNPFSSSFTSSTARQPNGSVPKKPAPPAVGTKGGGGRGGGASFQGPMQGRGAAPAQPSFNYNAMFQGSWAPQQQAGYNYRNMAQQWPMYSQQFPYYNSGYPMMYGGYSAYSEDYYGQNFYNQNRSLPVSAYYYPPQPAMHNTAGRGRKQN